MTRNQTVLALGLAFVVGCIAGPIASRAVAPAHAQSPTRKWEEVCTHRKSYGADADAIVEAVNKDLAEKDAAGWGLVSTATLGDAFLYCFRRALP